MKLWKMALASAFDYVVPRLFRVLLVTAVVAFLAGAMVGSASAATPSPSIYLEAWEMAQKHSPYKCENIADPLWRSVYCGPIEVRIVPHRALNDHPAGDTVGRFKPEEANHITVSERVPVDSLAFKDVVAHEYTHYLQWLFGQFTISKMNCNHLVDMEEEAYKVSEAVLRKGGETPPDRRLFFVMRRAHCNEPV